MSKLKARNATDGEASNFISLPASNNSKENTILLKRKILYVESKKKHTCLVVADLNIVNKPFSPFVIGKDIGHYMDRLPGDIFQRIHKSCCVNLDYISTYNKTDSMITMKDTRLFKVAVRRRKEFLQKVCW